MNIGEALILGLVQGLTEFLPISSSGHLVFAKHFLGGVRQPGILFEVLLHLGTLIAVLLYFKKDIISILKALLPSKNNNDRNIIYKRKLALGVVVGTIPTVIISILFKDFFESIFDSVKIVSIMLLVTGILLYLSDRYAEGKKSEVPMKDAIIIGIVQGVAIIPGISRSGSTIATGIFRGIKSENAARFSFLLSIPAILGAVVLKLSETGDFPVEDIFPYSIGVATAAVSGFLSIKVLMKIVSGKKLRYFAYYCWIIGILSLAFNL